MEKARGSAEQPQGLEDCQFGDKVKKPCLPFLALVDQ